MFASNTVFVLGAGASREAGLPTGAELKEVIANDLCFKFDHRVSFDRPITGNRIIFDALHRYDHRNQCDLNKYLLNARWISEAMPQAISIDNFLDVQPGNAELEFCGKLAIAHAILKAEANSRLMFNAFKQEQFEPQKLDNTWYQNLFMLLAENVKLDTVADILKNVSFVVFNYDRCLEHFLYHSIQNFYHLSDEDAATLLATVDISHPYGVIGKLDWQNERGIAFGASQDSERLIEIAGQIKTFTERVEDETARDAIRQQIQAADTIVFLGFAFHIQNLDLIAPVEPDGARRVFATMLGLSGADTLVIEEDIYKMLQKNRSPVPAQIHTAKLNCAALLVEYGRTLSQR
jgi:hypothetical protein